MYLLCILYNNCTIIQVLLAMNYDLSPINITLQLCKCIIPSQ